MVLVAFFLVVTVISIASTAWRAWIAHRGIHEAQPKRSSTLMQVHTDREAELIQSQNAEGVSRSDNQPCVPPGPLHARIQAVDSSRTAHNAERFREAD
jgi:hypothetical protein